jgi:putative membrane protein
MPHRIALNDTDRDRIIDAVRQAETGTAGEIIVVIDRAAGAYRSAPLVLALALTLLLPWPMLRFTGWSGETIYAIQLTVAALSVVILSIKGDWRLMLVPRLLKRQRAHEAAQREFIARGLTATRERTGVLIYVALAEHYAEVIADTGISGRVEPEVWRRILTELVERLRRRELADGLVEATQAVGAVLAQHAPPRADDTDELPNNLIVID